MGVLTAIVVVIHVLISLALIGIILLHSGKGGGLGEAFGGGMGGPQSSGGSTIAERNLDRLTVAIGIIFAITTVALTFLLA